MNDPAKDQARSALTVLLLLPMLFLEFSTMGLGPWEFGVMLLLLFSFALLKIELAALLFIVTQDTLLRHGGAAAISVACLAFALIPLTRNSPSRPDKPSPLPGLCLGAFIQMCFYQCSVYFDVGAIGAGMPALLNNYRMHGFHPNWRTVLFSTLMMVVLITWPRKFKKLGKILPAGLAGIVGVTLLNIILYPDASRTPIPELFWRIPASAVSMPLVFRAWGELPWKTIQWKNLRETALLCLLPAAMFCFDLLYVFGALGVVWALIQVAGRQKKHESSNRSEIASRRSG
ncbi:MAG: hypothetical protein FWH26_11230 [Oscillospiraceae bacterium]|nr:hypothetical protein [Oscillospiraceae bacterium]